MARKTKLTPELQRVLETHLALGCTIENACAQAGITRQTFFNWFRRGEKSRNGVYFSFFDAITRAKVQAHTASVKAIRLALEPTETVTNSTDTITETRLKTVKHEDGTIEQVPYEYTKTTLKQSVTKHPPDWRAGIEYLKRRDSRNWSDKLVITVEDLREKAIADIQAGRITYEALSKQDQSLADELFRSAGVAVNIGSSESGQPD